MDGKEFLNTIGFETCPATNAQVSIYLGEHVTQNTIYKSDKVNDYNFITIKRSNPKIFSPKSKYSIFDLNNFAINGVKNGVCFWAICLVKDKKFSLDTHKPLYIDINKSKYSELDVNYFIKNEDSFIKKTFTDKFFSIKEFWDYLDKFDEFKQK